MSITRSILERPLHLFKYEPKFLANYQTLLSYKLNENYLYRIDIAIKQGIFSQFGRYKKKQLDRRLRDFGISHTEAGTFVILPHNLFTLYGSKFLKLALVVCVSKDGAKKGLCNGDIVVVKPVGGIFCCSEIEALKDVSEIYIADYPKNLSRRNNYPHEVILKYIPGVTLASIQRSLFDMKSLKSSLLLTKSNHLGCREKIRTVLHISQKIVEALHKIHDGGWVHGDVQPKNIIYNPEVDRVTIIDFGSAQMEGVLLNASEAMDNGGGSVFGWHIEKNGFYEYTKKSDVYLLGMTIAYMFGLLQSRFSSLRQLKNITVENLRLIYFNQDNIFSSLASERADFGDIKGFDREWDRYLQGNNFDAVLYYYLTMFNVSDENELLLASQILTLVQGTTYEDAKQRWDLEAAETYLKEICSKQNDEQSPALLKDVCAEQKNDEQSPAILKDIFAEQKNDEQPPVRKNAHIKEIGFFSVKNNTDLDVIKNANKDNLFILGPGQEGILNWSP